MPQRSVIELLPANVRSALDREIVKANFSGFEELAARFTDYCHANGLEVEIHKSQVHRHSERLRAVIDKAKQRAEESKALVEALGDDQHALTQATLLGLQEKLMDLADRLDPEEVTPKDIANLTKAARDLEAGMRNRGKWVEEIQRKAQEAADRVEKIATKGGLSAEAKAELRREILGVAA